MLKKFRKIKLLSVILPWMFAISCSMQEKLPSVRDYGDLSEMRANLPDRICVYDPSELFKGQIVKSDSEEPVFIDKDDLDYENASFYETDSMKYVQIPINNVGLPDSNVIRFVKIETESPYSSPGTFKTYLIYRTRPDGSEATASIVMIDYQPKYMTEEEISSLDFFNTGSLNGVILYGDMDGSIYLVEMVINGETAGLYEILSCDASMDEGVEVLIYYPDMSTSSDDDDYRYGGFLDPAIIVGNRGRDLPGEGEDILVSRVDNTDKPVGNNGEHGYGPAPGDDDKDGEDEEEEVYAELIINEQGSGMTTGEGMYQIGFPITCEAFPAVVGGVQLSEFIGWTGAYESTSPKITFSLIESGTHVLNAVFHDYAPCYDAAKLKADPLLEMEILGTKNNGIAGGRFGDARGRKHNGIDLDCPVRTPVYSTMNGIVTGVRSGIGLESYDDYKKRVRNASKRSYNTGNAIYITSGSGDDAITSVYWHLTEVYVHEGQPVMCGELIGTSGLTGNAFDPYNPDDYSNAHLHYGVKEGGRWAPDTCFVDPEKYLYAIFDNEGKNTKKCD